MKHGSLRDLIKFALTQMLSEGIATADQCEAYLIDRKESAFNVIGTDDAGVDVPANQITQDDVSRWLCGFHQAGALTSHPRAYLSAAFGRCLSADHDPTGPNPELRFNLSTKLVTYTGGKMNGTARNRFFSMSELTAFWNGFLLISGDSALAIASSQHQSQSLRISIKSP
ncbi:hypothetical protein ABVF61_25810 [Roseibium sp. HPY-6]|uniref:hypothetical protein n=1 Tax=Roseibium sp. HPY-6 TaxID=3229852 RepID=UPI00338F30D5